MTQTSVTVGKKARAMLLACMTVLASLLVLPLVLEVPLVGGSSGDLPTNGTDWTITQTTVIDGGSYWVKNITVRTGKSLTIRNAQIEIKSYSGAPSTFKVNYTSSLEVYNSTIQNKDNYHWKALIDAEYLYTPPEGWRGAHIHLDNSSFMGVVITRVVATMRGR